MREPAEHSRVLVLLRSIASPFTRSGEMPQAAFDPCGKAQNYLHLTSASGLLAVARTFASMCMPEVAEGRLADAS